jgi:hypothetical protein
VLLTAPVTSLTLQSWSLAAARSGIDLTFWLWGGARLEEAATWIADRAGVVYYLRQKEAGHFVPLLARRRGARPDPIAGRDPIGHMTQRFLRTAIVRYFELWGPLDGLRMQRALDGGPALRHAVDGMLQALAEETRETTRWGKLAGAIEQSSDGTWVAERLPQVYPEVSRLLPSGAAACKVIAHAYDHPQSEVAWLPVPGVAYRGRRYASRLAAQWAVFFDELGVDATYAPAVDGLRSDDLEPDFQLLGLESLLAVRRLAPAHDDQVAAQRLAIHANRPVILLHGLPGVTARGSIWLPESPGGPVVAEPAPFLWSACAHCSQLLARAQLSAGLSLILCCNLGCPSREVGVAPDFAARTPALFAATQACQQARFEPWHEAERSVNA